ncbi:MAG TPA: hypothetical protein VMV10_31140 [Pirellulales bacterium]|nr:hypothetical protein [Pirellulales bacterium]
MNAKHDEVTGKNLRAEGRIIGTRPVNLVFKRVVEKKALPENLWVVPTAEKLEACVFLGISGQ